MTGNTATISRGVVLEDHIRGRISQLQAHFLAGVPSVVAELARLRRAIQGSPGSDPTVWSVIFENWPEALPASSNDPTLAENAAHAAVCLYAIHQQGRRDDGMHQRKWSLGRSVGLLAVRLGADSESAVKRRFDALVTAVDLREVLHHSRGLITQLRGEKIPLDYGLLAKHLYWLQNPAAADHARLRWARDYYFRPTSTSLTTNPEGALL